MLGLIINLYPTAHRLCGGRINCELHLLCVESLVLFLNESAF